MNEREKRRKKIIEKLKLLKSIYGVAARKELEVEQEEELIRIVYEEVNESRLEEHLEK